MYNRTKFENKWRYIYNKLYFPLIFVLLRFIVAFYRDKYNYKSTYLFLSAIIIYTKC